MAEAVQTMMRRHGLPEPYEQLKALTRGQPLMLALMLASLTSWPCLRTRLCG